MATYKVSELARLSDKLLMKAGRIDSMLASTINAASTMVRQRSVDEITGRVLLQPSYVKQYLKVNKRASPSNLRAEIWANERAVLLARYPYIKTKSGIKSRVKINSGFTEIPGAFIINALRKSGATGIAMRNTVFYEFYKDQTHKTPRQKARLVTAAENARTKPKGITVLHSSSINELFKTVRGGIRLEVRRFMVQDFKARIDKE